MATDVVKKLYQEFESLEDDSAKKGLFAYMMGYFGREDFIKVFDQYMELERSTQNLIEKEA